MISPGENILHIAAIVENIFGKNKIYIFITTGNKISKIIMKLDSESGDFKHPNSENKIHCCNNHHIIER